MKNKLITSLVAATFALSGSVVNAAGELNIYNWGNYTPPDLIEKFEKEFDIKVTITDYDSNDTALANATDPVFLRVTLIPLKSASVTVNA